MFSDCLFQLYFALACCSWSDLCSLCFDNMFDFNWLKGRLELVMFRTELVTDCGGLWWCVTMVFHRISLFVTMVFRHISLVTMVFRHISLFVTMVFRHISLVTMVFRHINLVLWISRYSSEQICWQSIDAVWFCWYDVTGDVKLWQIESDR